MAPPSEFDLRAALREGEGDKPNIHRVMVAVDARRQRRVRIASVAAIVAVAGGLGVTAAAFGGSSHESGGSALGARGAASNDNAAGAAPAPSAAKDALARVSCPSAAPDYAAAETHGQASAGTSSSLFAGPVSSVVVCAYGPAAHAQGLQRRSPARLELAGSQAKRVARSLENAPTTAPTVSCSSSPIEQYAVIPVDASGNQGRPIVAQVPRSACGALVTNGTAIRYDWQPPPAVAAKLDELSPGLAPDSPAPAASPTPSATS